MLNMFETRCRQRQCCQHVECVCEAACQVFIITHWCEFILFILHDYILHDMSTHECHVHECTKCTS